MTKITSDAVWATLKALTPAYSFRSFTRVGQNGEYPLVILSVSEG
jgi:hypothetical protein